MTDAEAVENARENERELGDEFAKSRLPDDPKPEQAWAYVNELWEGDPGGRGWQVRVPAGATWLSLRRRGRSGSGRWPGADVRVRRAAGGRGRLGAARLLTVHAADQAGHRRSARLSWTRAGMT